MIISSPSRLLCQGLCLVLLLPLSVLCAYQGPNIPPISNQNNPEVMRAWTCSGRNQRNLVDHLRQAKILQSPAAIQVMNQVDRVHYTPQGGAPYQDAPQVIGWGQTISAPHMHAHALEDMLPYLQNQREAHPEDPLKVLDVGCGSGYLTACLGRWFQPHASDNSKQEPILGSGFVWGIDIHPQLVQTATDNIRKADGDLLDSGVIKMQTANGWEGLPEAGPFDAIHVGASAAALPRELAAQLKPGGVLIVPVGPQTGAQYLYKVERQEANSDTFDPKEYRFTKLLGVRYVPLIDEPPN